ncbi:MAG: aminoacyl-tRNA hydrolase [Pseudomonadota bacterium]
MLLLVGLGNPGAHYRCNRHNIGFLAVERIAEAYGFAPPRKRFQGVLREGVIEGVKTLVFKPQTYMNLSGQAVGEALRFYKLDPAEVVVVYDEIDLAPGKVRMKRGGGAGGHNGIRSIDAHIGPDYRRLRLGVGHPGVKDGVTRHVLGDFAKADAIWLEPLLDAIAAEIGWVAKNDDARFLTALALRLHKTRQDTSPLPAADGSQTTKE